jgi:hypothetical protein
MAKITLMSYVTPRRGDVALGLASIILCTYALSLSKSLHQGDQGKWGKVMPWVAGLLVALLFVLHGSAFAAMSGQYRTVNVVLILSTIAGLLSGLMLSGWSKPFYVLMGIIVVLTTAAFNPLCTNLDHIYKSELAEQIVRLNNESNDRPLWLGYGSVHPGILVTAVGGRSLSGVHWPPQLSLWKELDPYGAYLPVYNRYAHFQLTFEPNELRIAFDKTGEDSYNVRISPNNAALISKGARYVLAMGTVQPVVKASNFIPVYKSPRGTFTIYEIGPKAPP